MKKTLAALIAAAAVLAASCSTLTPDQQAAIRKEVVAVVSVAWKAGGKACADAEVEKYIAKHNLDDTQAATVRAVAAALEDLLEQQLQPKEAK